MLPDADMVQFADSIKIFGKLSLRKFVCDYKNVPAVTVNKSSVALYHADKIKPISSRGGFCC